MKLQVPTLTIVLLLLAVCWQSQSLPQHHHNKRVAGVSVNLDLDYSTAVQLAGPPLHCTTLQSPHQSLGARKDLNPIFYGCYDWHSAVHGHWTLARAAALYPDSSLAQNVTSFFNKQFTEENVEKELKFFQFPGKSSFEQTYGWAWLLKLQEELEKSSLKTGSSWNTILRPLTNHVVDALKTFLPTVAVPDRSGHYNNTAFLLSLALDYARSHWVQDKELETMIETKSSYFYLTNKSCFIDNHPSHYNFFSPCLQEADLMIKVIKDQEQFKAWIHNFLPQMFDSEFFLRPYLGKNVAQNHNEGLNFSRAWTLYSLARRLGGKEGRKMMRLGDQHVKASMKTIEDDYLRSHWLATYLLKALEARATVV